MPKKINFLGGQQNYDADNGQYLPELKGPNGEIPTGFKNFKKAKSEFEKANDKRLGKVKEEESEVKHFKGNKDYIKQDHDDIMEMPNVYLEDKEIEQIKQIGKDNNHPYTVVLDVVATYMANGLPCSLCAVCVENRVLRMLMPCAAR